MKCGYCNKNIPKNDAPHCSQCFWEIRNELSRKEGDISDLMKAIATRDKKIMFLQSVSILSRKNKAE